MIGSNVSLTVDESVLTNVFALFLIFTNLLTVILQLLDPTMDLRTVKHYLWKNSGEIVLHYKILK